MKRRWEIQGCEGDFLEDNKFKKRTNSIHHLSLTVATIFIVFLVSLYGIIYMIDGFLPAALKISDEKQNPNAFIAERARHNLKILTDIGPRVVGSYENEVLAVDFLKREITLIQEQAHLNRIIEIDAQKTSGSYYLEFKPYGCINAYSNIQNIVVKLSGKNNSKHSLLVNCHFDSVPTSPGGSDDGINCVIMLEVLRKLSQLSERTEYNIIFLFNGAEETVLQASHAFITQHKWAKEVQVFVNLEAAGTGSKEILFQAGPDYPWLINYYSLVPHPHGQAAGEEIFQSGLIPSDTDFRIFRDFGNAIGLDFAFARNGYRYHTKYDNFNNIPLGSYQHVGDNVLSLVRHLANAPELSNPKGQPNGKTVFYDFLGMFMITYSETTAFTINIMVSCLSLIIAIKTFYDCRLGFSKHSLIYLIITTAALVLGWILGAAFVVAISFIIDTLNFSMSWYNNPWIIFGLYVAPVVVCSSIPIVILNSYDNNNNLSASIQTQMQLTLLRLMWTVALFLGSSLKFRFVYVILLPVLFTMLAFFMIQCFHLQHSIRKWKVIYVLSTVIPNIFSMQQAIEVLGTLIPIYGRIGPERKSETYIAILVFLLTILTTWFYVPFITLVRKSTILLAVLAGIFCIFFLIVFTPIGFPYSGNHNAPAPQRFWVCHTSRKFHNESGTIYKQDAGFVLLNMDRNSPNSIKKYVRDLGKIKSIADDCDNSLFCGLPITNSRMIAILRESTWIPAEQPIIHEPMKLKLNLKSSLTDAVIQFNFTSTGPSHQVIYISPRTNITLIKTNLVPEISSNTIIWNGRPTYVIVYIWGKENTPLTFTLDFKKSNPEWNGPIFDIALIGNYVHDKLNHKTPHFIQFLSEFPDWTDIISWHSTYESWVY